MAKASNKKSTNVFARLIVYVRGAWTELHRVVWPGPTEVLNMSIVVIVALLFFVAFTLVVDSVSVYVVELVSRIGG